MLRPCLPLLFTLLLLALLPQGLDSGPVPAALAASSEAGTLAGSAEAGTLAGSAEAGTLAAASEAAAIVVAAEKATCPTAENQASPPAPKALNWEELAPGLDLAKLTRSTPLPLEIKLLRIDPLAYRFVLKTSLWDTPEPQSISAWMNPDNLLAAINACMFLPNNQPTAYMRRGEQSTSRPVAAKYGGFFVSGPRQSGLPQADILDKTQDDWENILPQYDLVIQNMRLMGDDGEALWPENGPAHSAAIIAKDRQGRILFILCRSPLNMYALACALKAQEDLQVTRAIYVEGGAQTVLALKSEGKERLWTGRGPALLLGQGMLYPLPSILGILPQKLPLD